MTLKELMDAQLHNNLNWFPEKAYDLKHHVLGMAGEVGEVANLIKKWDRGDFDLDEVLPGLGPEYATSYREIIGEEVIDVLIYVLSICAILGINPDEVLEKKNGFNAARFGGHAPRAVDSTNGIAGSF